VSDLGKLLDDLDAARAEATPGPWAQQNGARHLVYGNPDEGMFVCAAGNADYPGPIADAALIVAAVNALPRLTAALRAVEVLAEGWRYKGEFGWGPWQSGEGPDIEGQILDEVASKIRAVLTPGTTP
jgi:hypothetical protein